MASSEAARSLPSIIAACVLLLLSMAVCVVPAVAQGGASHPGDSTDAVFGARRGPADPLGAAILNVDSGMVFADFQSAIDAAVAGDTLQVQALDHLEGQVVVDKSLTLEGQSGDEVVRMAVDTGSMGDDRAWFLVEAGVNLVVQDLTFDGDGHLIWQAFRHRGGGRFENCTFVDIQFNAQGPDFAGTAIVAFGDNVNVVDCDFSAIGRVGVLAFGTGVAGSLFQGNTYLGKGDGPHLDYGLELGAGAVVTATGNRIRANTGIAPDASTSSAVLSSTFFAAGTAADFSRNDFGDNLFSIITGFDATDTSVVGASYNRLAGNIQGAVRHASSVPMVAQFNWWGCNEGPVMPDCDPIDGAGTVSFDPWAVFDATFDTMPAQFKIGDSDPLIGFLLDDSNDVPLVQTFLDGIEVAFDGGPLGTADPLTSGTVGGLATSLWTATASGNDFAVVTLDAQPISLPVEVLPNVPAVEIPTLGEAAMAFTVLLLGVLGWRRLRRHDAPGRG